ncbi:hypothetical protein GCM10029992_06860 [Glycomyces albus]
MFELVLCPLLMLAAVALSGAAVRAHRLGIRRIRSLSLGVAALMALFLTWMVYGLGEFGALVQDIEELCPAEGAGEMVGYHATSFPLSSVLECSTGNIQLVPAWVNPALFALIGAAIAFAAAAVIAWRRRI